MNLGKRADFMSVVAALNAYLAAVVPREGPDESDELIAVRPWRAAIADSLHMRGLAAAEKEGLGDLEWDLFHKWRLRWAPWVIPDSYMQHEFVGLADAFVTRGLRRQHRWVHQRRARVDPDGVPWPAVRLGTAGSGRKLRPAGTVGRVRVRWRGRGEPPLHAEGLSWDKGTQGWVRYVRAITGSPLHPALAGQVRLPGAEVRSDRYQPVIEAAEEVAGRGGISSRIRAFSHRVESWQRPEDGIIEPLGAPIVPAVEYADFWLVPRAGRPRHHTADWGRLLPRHHNSDPPAALWQMATGQSRYQVYLLPWDERIGPREPGISAGIRAYLLAVTGLDIGDGHIRSFDFTPGRVQRSAHRAGLAAARKAMRRHGWLPYEPEWATVVQDWLERHGPSVVPDDAEAETFDGPGSMVEFYGGWKRQRWQSAARQGGDGHVG